MIKPPNNINTDISNNRFFFDISNNKLKNPDFFNLHNPSNIKLNNNLCNNYLNSNDDTFNMRIKKLLDNVENERKRIENQLLLEDKKVYTKQDIDSYMNLISNKYDSIYRPAFQKNSPPPGILNPFDTKPPLFPPVNKIFSPPKPLHIKKEKININVSIDNINDILGLIKKYPPKFDVEYNINMQSLHNIEKP